MILRAALEQVRSRPAYAGHLSDGSSIQKHSAGSNYPYIVRIHEQVDLGIGHAQVIDSMENMLFMASYPLDNKDARLEAYAMAYDAADAFAEAKRLGVVR